MRKPLGLLVGCCVLGLLISWGESGTISARSFLLVPLVAVCAGPPIGTFWMLYVSIRHEKDPVPYMLMAFVPFMFVWYYFERYKTGKHTGRISTETEGRETAH